MAWMACRSCSAKFAVGLLRCPQCSAVSELFAVPEEVVEAEQEQKNMPKISVEGGPSNAADTTVEAEAEATVEAAATEPEDSTVTDEPAVDAVEPAVEDAAPDDANEAADAKPAAAPAKPATAKATKKAAAKQ